MVLKQNWKINNTKKKYSASKGLNIFYVYRGKNIFAREQM
jgi:hypothetical protein